jgi:DNA-binding NarL/FixJ family response regulator
MIRVFIAALTPTLRAGLRAFLSGGELQVVGEAATLTDLADGLPVDSDVLVVANEELLAELAAAPDTAPLPALLLLADTPQPAARLPKLTRRGWGIVAPDAPAAELQAAGVAVAQGLVVLPLALSGQLLSQATEEEAETDAEPLDEPLTAREHEVLELLGQGLPNKLIARQLQISEHTVKFHVSSIYAKLGASSRTEAISRGARRGLITL